MRDPHGAGSQGPRSSWKRRRCGQRRTGNLQQNLRRWRRRAPYGASAPPAQMFSAVANSRNSFHFIPVRTNIGMANGSRIQRRRSFSGLRLIKCSPESRLYHRFVGISRAKCRLHSPPKAPFYARTVGTRPGNPAPRGGYSTVLPISFPLFREIMTLGPKIVPECKDFPLCGNSGALFH